ncbi:phytanoyl-CoA dioxygenase family protein [Sphingomonas sp. AOB5]|uniref:phytanoyl-CoA dioxygenase family protein n=1 Tax=Sphingomonas sp. AOB5 TaxID=3034017 RepID=UPI0023F706D3|nr:phytanoyl-CoA dioxygenase family protein [Sphingomonas sp. AOB5]MDF7776718.1 phytanoyl-CoA dioxygenase family protein [Sphingomonas sp. AOB5]
MATAAAHPVTESVVTPAEVEAFQRDGFVVPKQGLDSDSTKFLVESVEQVFADNPDWQSIIRMPHVPIREGQEEGVIGAEKLFEIAIHPTIIAAARELIGPNLIMWGGEIFAKPAGTGKGTPWHQDCYNPAVKAGPGRSHAHSVMIWIAVDDVAADNGCLRYVPGSGKNGQIEHIIDANRTDGILNFEVDKQGVDFSTAVNAELKPGHFSCHDVFVVHGANANTSGRRRAGLTFHYMDAADLYDRSFGLAKAAGEGRKPAPLATRPIWLVLGENQNPENDFVTGHQNLEDLDALAEANRLRLNKLLL